MGDGLGQTYRSQIARLRRLAVKAMANYDLAEPRLELVAHGENTTFRVSSEDSRHDYSTFKDAFVRGYTEHRPLPDDQMDNLDSFIAAREVAFGLWLVGMAETRPSFREQLPAEFCYIERSLRVLSR